jgi:hypothetical protein
MDSCRSEKNADPLRAPDHWGGELVRQMNFGTTSLGDNVAGAFHAVRHKSCCRAITMRDET